MDIKDVSGVDRCRAFFDHLKSNAKRASLRKGEVPRDHPPPGLLVHHFMITLAQAAIRGSTNEHTLSTSQVPPHYPPCVRAMKELTPLMISRMTLEHHHRGSRALIHVLTPPDRMTALMAIVEDEEATAVLLQLYNQPEELKVSKEHILQVGNVCIVKDPFFKATTDGSYSLRVDHVSDIIWLADTDDRIPLKWRKEVLCRDESSQGIRIRGNAAVQKREWAEAERLYTQAVCTATTLEEGQLAHLNRSLTNLRLDRPERALNDAYKASSSGDVLSEKALFREAKALYALGKFKPCMDKLLVLVRCKPQNTEVWTEIKRVKQRLYEEETGLYQYAIMYKQIETTPPLVDCATYIGPVTVRDSAGRGKGLFTTRSVKAGELLLCEKAFAYSYAGDDSPVGRSNIAILMNLSMNTMCVGGQAQLITQIVQKLYHDPASAESFTGLHHGDYNRVKVSEVDGAPVVDTFLVVKIIQLNCFGAPRSSYGSIGSTDNDGNEKNSGNAAAYTTCGIWTLASRINHSCITNCRRSFIGDVQIVRASMDMEADTELHFGYRHPSPHKDYGETQKDFRTWGFVCHCVLCLNKKSTPRNAVQQRRKLRNSLKALLKPGASMMQLTRARRMLEDLEKTYTNPPLVPRLELWDPYFALGAELLTKRKLRDGLEMLLKGLEDLGFSVMASPPRDAICEENGKKATLRIERWGQSNDYVPPTFLRMMHAYQELAPELCEVAREYARVSYSICYGETETIGTLDPLLA